MIPSYRFAVSSRLSPSPRSFLSNSHDGDEERNENDKLLRVIPAFVREFGLALGLDCAGLRDRDGIKQERSVVGRHPEGPETEKSNKNLPNQR